MDWKKSKSDENIIFATNGKDRWEIRKVQRKFQNIYESGVLSYFVLTLNKTVIYEFSITKQEYEPNAKKAAKNFAEVYIKSKGKPYYTTVAKQMKKTHPEYVDTFLNSIFLDLKGTYSYPRSAQFRNVLDIPAPNKEVETVFKRLARAGTTPMILTFSTDALKGTKIDPAELTTDVLHAAVLRYYPELHKADLERNANWSKQRAEEYQIQATAEKRAKKQQEEMRHVRDTQIKENTYKGDPPARRSRSGRVVVALGIHDSLLVGSPLNAKYSSLIDWVEEIRDNGEKKNQFITIGAIIGLLRGSKYLGDHLRREKAIMRIKSIYQDEWEQESQIGQAHVRRAMIVEIPESSKVAVKVKAELDKFGNKGGTDRAKVNAVMTDKFKSVKLLLTQSGVQSPVHAHLKQKVEEGHFEVKIKRDGLVKYRLAEKWRQVVSPPIVGKKAKSAKKK